MASHTLVPPQPRLIGIKSFNHNLCSFGISVNGGCWRVTWSALRSSLSYPRCAFVTILNCAPISFCRRLYQLYRLCGESFHLHSGCLCLCKAPACEYDGC